MAYTNTQIEKVIIGCLLLKGSLYEKIINEINCNDFSSPLYKRIFQIIERLYSNNIKIDNITISDYAHSNNISGVGLAVLYDIQNIVPTVNAFDQYLKLLKKYSYERKILKLTEDYRLGKINSDKLEDGLNKIKLPEEINKETNKDIILKALDEAEKGTDFKFPDDFDDLNKITGGFDRGDLIIVGGYASSGKSSLCTALTVGFCNDEHNVLVLTLEMSARANMRRILANTQTINTMKFRRGTLEKEDREKIEVMIPMINDIWKYNCIRVYKMADIIRAIAEYKPDIVIIDYLQNIADTENLTEYARLTKFTLQIQQIAREKNTAAILLSQFHRPEEGRIRGPRNNDFRGSGSIEERAEIILLLYWERKLRMESLFRKDGENPEYMIINVTKNKDGETGKVKMKFYPEYHRWKGWEKDTKEVIYYENAIAKSKKDFKKRYKEKNNE